MLIFKMTFSKNCNQLFVINFVFRLHAATSTSLLAICAQAESLLLQTYNIRLPATCIFALPPGKRDTAATGVLQIYQPMLLKKHIPPAPTTETARPSVHQSSDQLVSQELTTRSYSTSAWRQPSPYTSRPHLRLTSTSKTELPLFFVQTSRPPCLHKAHRRSSTGLTITVRA